jgi:hypothetical protein
MRTGSLDHLTRRRSLVDGEIVKDDCIARLQVGTRTWAK